MQTHYYDKEQAAANFAKYYAMNNDELNEAWSGIHTSSTGKSVHQLQNRITELENEIINRPLNDSIVR